MQKMFKILIFIQVLRDSTKARREVELHWRASGCKHIVNVIDVYENSYGGHKCILVVMEWYLTPASLI